MFYQRVSQFEEDPEDVYVEDGIYVIEKKGPNRKYAAGEEPDSSSEATEEVGGEAGWDARPLLVGSLILLMMVLWLHWPMLATLPRPSLFGQPLTRTTEAPLMFDNPLPGVPPTQRPLTPPTQKLFVDPLDDLQLPLKVRGVEHLANDETCLPCFFNDTGRVRRSADESQEAFMLYGVPGFQRFEIVTHIYNPETGRTEISRSSGSKPSAPLFSSEEPFQFFTSERLDADEEDWTPITPQYQRLDSLLNWEKGMFVGETSPTSRYIKIQFGEPPAFWSNWRPQVGQVSLYIADVSDESPQEGDDDYAPNPSIRNIDIIPEDLAEAATNPEGDETEDRAADGKFMPLAGFTTADSDKSTTSSGSFWGESTSSQSTSSSSSSSSSSKSGSSGSSPSSLPTTSSVATSETSPSNPSAASSPSFVEEEGTQTDDNLEDDDVQLYDNVEVLTPGGEADHEEADWDQNLEEEHVDPDFEDWILGEQHLQEIDEAKEEEALNQWEREHPPIPEDKATSASTQTTAGTLTEPEVSSQPSSETTSTTTSGSPATPSSSASTSSATTSTSTSTGSSTSSGSGASTTTPAEDEQMERQPLDTLDIRRRPPVSYEELVNGEPLYDTALMDDGEPIGAEQPNDDEHEDAEEPENEELAEPEPKDLSPEDETEQAVDYDEIAKADQHTVDAAYDWNDGTVLGEDGQQGGLKDPYPYEYAHEIPTEAPSTSGPSSGTATSPEESP